MSDTTPILALPLIQPAQAQKHVTHNEAIARLDVLVQAAVASRSLATPPASPAPGERWIVGPDPVGDWAGRAGQIAWWGDTGWAFVAPAPGWTVQVLDEAVAVVFRDGAWQGPEGQRLQVAGLGVNTPADATNGLAVAAPASLLTHQGAGHQLKVNKATPADTASLLFQTGFSGRAEMGTTGSDEFEIKVSDDGTGFATAFRAASATGRATLPGGALVAPGSAAAPGLAFDGDADTGLFRAAADVLALAVGGAECARVTTGGLQVTGLISGTAVTQSATDTTVGRLMKVGDGGWLLPEGGTLTTTIADASTALASGLYYTSNITLNLPVTDGSQFGTLQQINNQNNSFQFWYPNYAGGGDSPRIWIRRKLLSSGVYTAWTQLLSQMTSVGPVTQSGGVPTGAIIETGD
ncbi:MAG: DUF2793 domain-containing protein, partial [Rhodobacterales bacterium]|nr:DUF2793 domain-containing protein [Rhodobacterales bacterium]